jgi:hypothetical protein
MAPGLVARMVVGLLPAIASIASAQRREVAVIDLSTTQSARQLATELTKALNNHIDLKPLDNPVLTAALQGDFEDEDANHLARARALKQRADEFLANVDDGNAASSAREGMEELAFVQPTSEMLGLFADLAFTYGRAQIGLRRPNDASLAFQLAHRLDPGRTPDPTRFEPNIIAAFEAAKAKPTIAAKLAVQGNGRVWIDGIEQGPAGETFGTSEGLHLVQLTGPERETRGEQVLVPAVTTATLADARATEELKVKRARIALARARDAAERATLMKKLTGLLGVGDAVLIARGGETQLTVQTWRNQEQGFSALISLREQKPIELLTPLAPPRPVEPRPPITIPELPPPPPPTPWWRKNWIRASIAGGVVLGVASVIFYVSRDQELAFDPNIGVGDQ